VRVERKQQEELSGGGICGEEFFFEFSSKKMQHFMHFYCEKLHLWSETGTRGLNRPPGGLKV